MPIIFFKLALYQPIDFNFIQKLNVLHIEIDNTNFIVIVSNVKNPHYCDRVFSK